MRRREFLTPIGVAAVTFIKTAITVRCAADRNREL
jgi:hypothetical protein